MTVKLRKRDAILLLAIVAFAWGTSWPVTKLLLNYLPPFWTTAARSVIATVVLFGISLGQQRLRLPRNGDLPVILNIALLHMVGFSGLVALGLQFVPVGRSIVLAYTTPLWVMIGARIFFGEALTFARLIAVASGLSGLLLLFNTSTFDWNDPDAVIGNALVLLAALCWAVSILHVRAHRWVSTTFEILPWEVLLATCVLMFLAFLFEGIPIVEWNARLVLLLLYGGIIGIALPYWAVVVVNRSLPVITTSLGLLGVPVVGVLCSVLALGEPVGVSLLIAMVLIVGGIVVGTSDALSAGRRG